VKIEDCVTNEYKEDSVTNVEDAAPVFVIFVCEENAKITFILHNIIVNKLYDYINIVKEN